MFCVLSGKEITAGVSKLANDIQHDYYRQPSPTLVWNASSGMCFATDLTRKLKLELPRIEVVQAEYLQGTSDIRQTNVFLPNPAAIKDKNIIVIDDILRTGSAMHAIIQLLNNQGARRVDVCVLIAKNARRKFPVVPKYCAFSTEDTWLAGYGLDFKGTHRDFSYIGSPKEALRPNQWIRRGWSYKVDSGDMW